MCGRERRLEDGPPLCAISVVRCCGMVGGEDQGVDGMRVVRLQCQQLSDVMMEGVLVEGLVCQWW